MSYLALYRKYRPDTFDKLIGQDHIVKTLVNQIKTERIGHAYLFTGTRGTGKTSAAKIFAKAINCLHPVNGSPCGKCEVCKALAEQSNLDIIEIDAASNNGVNEIRDLREKVQYPPVSGKYKVYIIDEVHMLSGAAFNALLKTLEEPPVHAVFILATTEAHKIPATILSRCMRFDFKLIPTDMIADLICSIYDECKKSYDKEAVFQIAAAGEGSIRDALSIADTALSYSDKKLTYLDVLDILGAADIKTLNGFTESIINSDTGKTLDYIDALCRSGKSIGVLCKDVTTLLRNLLIVKTCKNPSAILSIPTERLEELKKICSLCQEDRLLRILQIFSDVEASLKYSYNPRVLFEAAAVKAGQPQVDYDITAILSRVKDLEDKLVNVKNGTAVKKVEKSAVETSVKDENVNADSEEKTEETEKKTDNINTALNLADFDGKTVLGKLLSGLREHNHTMLWTVMQSVKAKVNGNALTLYVAEDGDELLLSRTDNLGIIEEELKEFGNINITIKAPEKERKLEEVDSEVEKLKKIFGDETVEIKD